jgi:MYXO-CTERM domain-containing protein
VTLSNGAGACWPTPTAAPECGDCLQTGTCVSGSQCYCIEGTVENCTAARCYKGCSPSQPSQCSTNYCFGDNTCACPDEVAGEGEPCGAAAGKVCPSGYQCFNSGTGAVCRQQCNPGSCPSDRVCAPVTGQNFSLCVPPAPQQDGGTGDGGGTDGGTTDAGDGGQDSGGTADAGTADSGGGTDAGTGDTGTTDAGGQTDAGTSDSGAADGGSTDAGDAGSTDGGSGSDGGSSVVPRRGGCNCGTAGVETWLAALGLVLLRRVRRSR